jgi:hypothetical protein
VQWGDSDDGTPVQLWDCNGTDAQKWSLDNGRVVGLGGKCLDVQWAQTANGTPVQLYTCNGTDAQKWSLQNGQLVGIGGKCLDVAGFNSVPGQALQIWDCNGGANQQFTVDGSTPPPPPPPPPPPSDDLAAAKAFLAPLRLGFNVERGWAWSVPGGPRAEAQYLKSLGVTHVRLFFPWSPTGNYGGLGFGVPSEQQMRTFLDAIDEWIAGGMVVFADAADLMGVDDFNGHKDTIYAEVQKMAELAATYHFPKDKLALGPINEWIGDDGNGGDPYGQYRRELHDIIRAALPGYVLTVSSDYWDYYRNLEAMDTLPDQRVIYSFHAYEQHSPGDWQGVAGGIADWSRAHGGVPVMMGEAGPYGGDMGQFLDDMEPAMAVFRPSLWAITYGSVLPWNKSGDDATLQDGLVAHVTGAVQRANAALAGNDGAP